MDNNKFFDLIIKADNGESDAINQLHSMYHDYTYSESLVKEEITHFKKIVTNDKPYLLYHIAMAEFYLNKNLELCEYYLEKSIISGCSQAHFVMAMMIKEGYLVSDHDQNQLMKKAILMNNSNAWVECAIQCNNIDEKIQLFGRAIELGNTNAIVRLGQVYHDDKKYKLAKKYYKIACNNNDHRAYFNLGVMYREGEGVKINHKVALRLFKKSMKLGNIRAITSMGSIYDMKGNHAKCKKYYKIAIENNDPVACYNLGNIYKMNNKIEKGIKYFIQGARLNHHNSLMIMQKYGIFDLDMTDDEIRNLCKFNKVF
jgi:TPR repeat protein